MNYGKLGFYKVTCCMFVVSFVLETGLEHSRYMYGSLFYLSRVLKSFTQNKNTKKKTHIIQTLYDVCCYKCIGKVSTKSHMYTIHLYFFT